MRNVRSNDNYVRTFLLNVFPLHWDRFSIIGDIHDKDGGGFLGVTSYLRALKESLYHTSSYIKIWDCIFSTLELQLIIAFASHVKCLEFNLWKFILEDELTLSGVKYKIEKLVFDLWGSDRYSGWVTHLERLKKLLTAIYISDDTKSIKSIVVNDWGLNKNIVKEVYEEYEERNQLILNQNGINYYFIFLLRDLSKSNIVEFIYLIDIIWSNDIKFIIIEINCIWNLIEVVIKQ